jgi:DNA gyrase subunit A
MTREHPEYPERNAEDELRNARLQMLIYEAIAIAASDAHTVLATVMGASAPEAAGRALQDRYGFTEVQASAVMDVQFRRLTSTYLHKIEEYRHELAARVSVLEGRPGNT